MPNCLAPDTVKLLQAYINEENKPGPDSFLSINIDGVNLFAELKGFKPAQAMAYLLKQGIWPRRFCRNRGILKAEEQAKLLESKAAVIGCGGLGAYVSILLSRMGLGALLLCDRDTFEESNLNRQLFSRENNLGRNKAEVAAEEIYSLASHIQLTVWAKEATADNLPEIIAGSNIVLDCLDSIATRLILEEITHKAGLPFVHGCIAGEEGLTMLSRPGQGGLRALYSGQSGAEDKNAEKSLGMPTITPAYLASLQAHLAIQEILGKKNKKEVLYHLDLSCPSLEVLYL